MGGELSNDSGGNPGHSDMALQVISVTANGMLGGSVLPDVDQGATGQRLCICTAGQQAKQPLEALAPVQNPGKEREGRTVPARQPSWLKRAPGSKRFSPSSSPPGGDPLKSLLVPGPLVCVTLGLGSRDIDVSDAFPCCALA